MKTGPENAESHQERTAPEKEIIILGNKPFTVVESPGKITFVDQQKNQRLDLFGNFDSAAIKKDMAENFKDSVFSFPYRH